MRKILNTAHVYMIVGLVSGLYYRELTKAKDFEGDTQLAVVHTHVLDLQVLFFITVGKRLPGTSRPQDAEVTRSEAAAPSASPGSPAGADS
ncbi:DUF2871 family protein [Streptomyces sp. Ag109_G2-15]|uniref:DUF2871 family protein n=1 Tax=Streptomyces sp. Ag109_G2-15 TaxID=1938850 RepID=UPI000BDB669E|nr:DUF2871 family protein [Streptomyces sp. Ag109_G2-15]SOD85067.1 Protein of unknown function [Streptomyces sp. Ag109_G2-15]